MNACTVFFPQYKEKGQRKERKCYKKYNKEFIALHFLAIYMHCFINMLYIIADFKGTVSRDFRPSVYSPKPS
jgi:hypothetical protein